MKTVTWTRKDEIRSLFSLWIEVAQLEAGQADHYELMIKAEAN